MGPSRTMSPTLTELQIRVEGRAAPKGSRNYGRSKNGRAYTWPASKHEKPWVEKVRDATREAMRRQPQIPPPYEIDVEILIDRGVRVVNPWPSQHDLDKLVRAIIDGLVIGKAMTDDRHIVEIHTRKRYAREDETPGAHARVSAATLEI